MHLILYELMLDPDHIFLRLHRECIKVMQRDVELHKVHRHISLHCEWMEL